MTTIPQIELNGVPSAGPLKTLEIGLYGAPGPDPGPVGPRPECAQWRPGKCEIGAGLWRVRKSIPLQKETYQSKTPQNEAPQKETAKSAKTAKVLIYALLPWKSSRVDSLSLFSDRRFSNPKPKGNS